MLNRFSSDTATADDTGPFTLNILLANIFGLDGRIITCKQFSDDDGDDVMASMMIMMMITMMTMVMCLQGES